MFGEPNGSGVYRSLEELVRKGKMVRGDEQVTLPKPTPDADKDKCMRPPSGFCQGGNPKDIPYMQVVNTVDASQEKGNMMCVGWDTDGIPQPPSAGQVGASSVPVKCFVSDPQSGDLVPNPKSMFRPYQPFASTVQNRDHGYNNYGDTLVTRLFPMDPAEDGVGTCGDWLQGNTDFFNGTGQQVPKVALVNPSGTSCDSMMASPFQYRAYASDADAQTADWAQFFYWSNYSDACALANRQCATNGAGDTGKVCHMEVGVVEPSFLNFERPEDLGGVVPGCPPKLNTGSHDGLSYPGSLGSNKWVHDMPPDGGDMPDGGPFPGAFVKLQYGRVSASSSGSCDPSKSDSCSGGQGGTCYKNTNTGEYYCSCKDSNAVGDCGTCKAGYSMDPKTATCVKDPASNKGKGFLGLSTETWVYIGGGVGVALLAWWALRGDKQQATPSQDTYFDE